MGVNGLCHNSVPIRSFQNSFQWEFRLTPIISAVFSVAYGSFILLPLQWEFPGVPLGVYCFLQLGVFRGRIGSSVDLHSRFFFCVCFCALHIYALQWNLLLHLGVLNKGTGRIFIFRWGSRNF